MRESQAFEISLLIEGVCAENSVVITPGKSLWDATEEVMSKQDDATLTELYQVFRMRSSKTAKKLIELIQKEWDDRSQNRRG